MKLSDLRKPLPPEKISHRSEGGNDIAYIAWHDAADVLDEACPDGEIAGPWTSRVVGIQSIEGRLCVTIALAIPYKVESDPEVISVNFEKKMVSTSYVERQATGFEYLIDPKTGKEISYGDAFSNASSMAFRRCCAMFGIGRELYKKGAQSPAPRSRGEFEAAARRDAERGPSSPEATGQGDEATPKQLVAIRAICNSKDIDAEAYCNELFGGGLTTAQLSRKAASVMIDKLKSA